MESFLNLVEPVLSPCIFHQMEKIAISTRKLNHEYGLASNINQKQSKKT